MSFTVTKEETYSLITLTNDSLAADKADKLKSECMKLIKGNPFIIMNCKALATISKEEKNLLISVNSLAKKAGGSLILTELHDDMIALMEKEGVNCVPTDDEAVDFIFMEQIENQFMDDDDDEDDDY